MRPPPILGSSVWATMPIRAVESCVRIWSCRLPGKASMMRLTVPWRAVGVQRAEHHVARFGGGDGRFDRFQVAHFADQDHVRVLPQGAADRLGEARHIDADLALVDRRFLVVVIELDRVFDRDDVVIDVLVDVVDQAGQRRAFARAGRPGDQEQAAGPQHQLQHTSGRPSCSRREHVVGNLPQHHRHVAALLEDRDAEAGQLAEGEAEVAPPFSCSSRWHRSGAMLFISATVSSGSSTFVSSFRIRPCRRNTGGWPTTM